LLPKLRGDVIYAIGGGLAVDAAKYVAAKANCPLVCVPTAISVDAFLTWASGYRDAGCVRYIETKPPDRVVVDLDLIAAGPLSIRSAGVTDVLSIATGRWDWKFAHLAGRNSEHTAYDDAIDNMAAAIEGACLACAASAGRGEPPGLRRLLECLTMEVQLCNLIGHSRPEEGSEHYFAYAAESILGKGLPHGDLVGPGILIMAFLQGQDITPLKEAMQAANVPLTRIPMGTVREILQMLPEYCQRHSLPYGIAHTLTHRQVEAIDPAILT
jgi:glycerol-1-phosphate dehydrogenase [NAD(P)+]